MDKRINLELRGRQPAKVKELDLSGCKTGGEIEGLTEEFESLEFLDINNCNITNIKSFPTLPNLRKLDISGNRLSKGLENLKKCTNLKHLIINNNKIRELEVLEPLKSLEHLTHFDVGIDQLVITGVDQHVMRAKIYELLPNIQFLDGYDIDGNEEDDDDGGIRNGKVLDDDVSDGDDELEDEEGEEEEEDDEDSEDEGAPDLSVLYDNGVVLQDDEDDEDYNDDASEDEDDELEDEDPEPEQSTRGKKRKLDDGTV